MNAGLASAFEDGGLRFALPLVVIQLVRPLASSVVTANSALRVHFRLMTVWHTVSAACWLLGAVGEPDARLLWWLLAVGIEVTGTLTAHALPWRRRISGDIPFDGPHMGERIRLFLIIALGEVVLTTGTAISTAAPSPEVIAAGVAAFVAVAALWALYFAGAAGIVEDAVLHASDRVRAARVSSNVQYLVFAGLVAVAVACELAVSHPLEHGGASFSLLLFGGALAYLVAQNLYIALTAGLRTPARWVAAGLLLVGIAVGVVLPRLGSLVALDIVLVGLVWLVTSTRPHAGAAR